MKNKLLTIGILSIIFYSPLTQAENMKLFVGGWSKHLSNKKSLNETHNTVGLSHRDFELMNFNNSYNNNSTYLGYHYDFNKYFGLRMGIVSGYSNMEYNIEGFIPVVQPTFRYEVLTFGVELGYIPYTGGSHKGAATLQTYFKF